MNQEIVNNKAFEGSLFKSLEENAHVGIYVMQDGKIQLVNNYTLQCLGRKKEELLGGKFDAFIHPDDRDSLRKNSIRMLKGEDVSSYKFRIITKKGELRWIDGAVTNVRYKGRRAVLGSSIDISEQLRSWHKVIELETIEASILKSIPHAVIGLRDRHVFFSNDGVKSVFGWEAEELIGKNTRVLYRDKKDYEKIGKLTYPEIKRSGKFVMEFPCRRKDGTDIECMVSVSGIGSTQAGRNIVATYEDITQRKRAERKLEESRMQLRQLSEHLQSVREKERTHIARELHDELGQLLMALNTDIILLKKQVSQKSMGEKIESMSNLITLTMNTLNRIYRDLRPAMLDHLGLSAAIEWQTKDFQNRTGIRCNIIKLEEMDIEPDLASAIFRIFQETLTNISRHAAATKVFISFEKEGNEINLHVRDNGRGIGDKDLQKIDSFGLLGIRERVHHWGGTVSINGKQGMGTEIEVKIPNTKQRELL